MLRSIWNHSCLEDLRQIRGELRRIPHHFFWNSRRMLSQQQLLLLFFPSILQHQFSIVSCPKDPPPGDVLVHVFQLFGDLNFCTLATVPVSHHGKLIAGHDKAIRHPAEQLTDAASTHGEFQFLTAGIWEKKGNQVGRWMNTHHCPRLKPGANRDSTSIYQTRAHKKSWGLNYLPKADFQKPPSALSHGHKCRTSPYEVVSWFYLQAQKIHTCFFFLVRSTCWSSIYFKVPKERVQEGLGGQNPTRDTSPSEDLTKGKPHRSCSWLQLFCSKLFPFYRCSFQMWNPQLKTAIQFPYTKWWFQPWTPNKNAEKKSTRPREWLLSSHNCRTLNSHHDFKLSNLQFPLLLSGAANPGRNSWTNLKPPENPVLLVFLAKLSQQGAAARNDRKERSFSHYEPLKIGRACPKRKFQLPLICRGSCC